MSTGLTYILSDIYICYPHTMKLKGFTHLDLSSVFNTIDHTTMISHITFIDNTYVYIHSSKMIHYGICYVLCSESRLWYIIYYTLLEVPIYSGGPLYIAM